MKTHRHKLKFPVFGDYVVKVVFCENIHNEAKRLKLDLPSGVDKDEVAYTAITPSGCTCVFDFNPGAETIVHEAYHAVAALLKFSGANADEELVAYHLGYLAGHITKWRDNAQAVRGDTRQADSRGETQKGSPSNCG
jgi:hypothetical protein